MPRRALALATALVACCVVPAVAHPGASTNEPGGTVWGFEHNVTGLPTTSGGKAPRVAVDRFGDAFIVAAKDPLVLGLDPRSPVQARLSAWSWVTTDNGETYDPTPTLAPAPLVPSLDAAVAIDDADNVYVVETSGVDAAVSGYHVRGRGLIDGPTVSPAARTVLPDTKPLLVAQGDGHLVYLADVGVDGVAAPPVFTGEGSGAGPGRYVAYASSDGGASFSPPYPLVHSVQCAAAADHRPRSAAVYVACTDGVGGLYSYASSNHGASFALTQVWKSGVVTTPAVAVGPDGAVWVLFSSDDRSKLRLARSGDGGKRWAVRDITKKRGTYSEVALASAPNGRLGIAAYYRPQDKPVFWYVLGGIWDPRKKTPPVLVNFADHDPVTRGTEELDVGAPSIAFGRDNQARLTWVRVGLTTTADMPPADVAYDVFFVQSVR